MILDLDKLKASPGDYDLYQIAYRRAGATAGVHDIGDISELKIGPNLRFRLAEASIQHESAIFMRAKRAAAAPPPPPPAPAVTEPQIDFAEVQREQEREIQTRADEAAARNRLNEYAAVGLEDSQANADAITAWIRQNANGYFSGAGIDTAISNLGPRGTNVLRWIPKVEAPAPTPAAEPTEHLEPWQLRIDATESEMKKADVKALKDLLARRRAATGQQYIGRGARTNRLVSNF
jgi:hypothetical protein